MLTQAEVTSEVAGGARCARAALRAGPRRARSVGSGRPAHSQPTLGHTAPTRPPPLISVGVLRNEARNFSCAVTLVTTAYHLTQPLVAPAQLILRQHNNLESAQQFRVDASAVVSDHKSCVGATSVFPNSRQYNFIAPAQQAIFQTSLSTTLLRIFLPAFSARPMSARRRAHSPSSGSLPSWFLFSQGAKRPGPGTPFALPCAQPAALPSSRHLAPDPHGCRWKTQPQVRAL